jgi:RNA polymerase sigma factor (sigma-70 family)
MSVNVSPSSAELAEQMHRHYGALYDYGMKLTRYDDDLTKDCIQDVFAAFWHRRDHWPDIESVRSYLLVGLRNRITDAYRRQQRFVPLLSFPDSDDPETVQPFQFTPPDEAETDAPARQLATALDKLPRRQREAIFLRYFQEMPYPDVARVMGVKERTAYNLVHEGLQHLRDHLSPVRWLMLGSLLLTILFFLKNF